jgi:hypothetical protein
MVQFAVQGGRCLAMAWTLLLVVEWFVVVEWSASRTRPRLRSESAARPQLSAFYTSCALHEVFGALYTRLREVA